MARIITTSTELDALPKRAVVRTNAPGEIVHVYEKWGEVWFGLGLIDEPHTPPLPATLLYTPED